MIKILRFTFLVFLCSLRADDSTCQQISYYLEINEQSWDSYHVRMTVENVDQSHLVFAMPAWRPGEYIRQDYGQYIQDFRAVGESTQSLNVVRLSQNMWDVQVDHSALVIVDYDIQPGSTQSLGIQLDSSCALIDGAMNFMYIKGAEHLPLALSVRVPDGWKLATPLKSTQPTFEYLARDYDQLIDSPILIARFDEYYFTVKDRPVYAIFHGPVHLDMDDFLVKTRRIVTYQSELFGELPFETYYFLFQMNKSDGMSGGLEHTNSTVISLSKSMNTNAIANLIAHEFFHSWNGERIHPAVFDPFDYSQESRTRTLWFVEGVTSYYADLTLLRTQIWSATDFLMHQAELIERLQENPDRLRTSVERASLGIWENGYHGPGISYYTKGQLIGLLLDLSMRKITSNQVSLDHLMRFMNQWYARSGKGFGEDDLLRGVNGLTNHDFSDFFNKYISGTVELPYAEILSVAGIQADIRTDQVPDLGLFRIDKEKRIIVLDEAGALADAGLKIGDRLLTIGGKSIMDGQSITSIIESLQIGKEIALGAEREGIPLTLRAIVEKKFRTRAQLTLVEQPDEQALRIRTEWFEGH